MFVNKNDLKIVTPMKNRNLDLKFLEGFLVKFELASNRLSFLRKMGLEFFWKRTKKEPVLKKQRLSIFKRSFKAENMKRNVRKQKSSVTKQGKKVCKTTAAQCRHCFSYFTWLLKTHIFMSRRNKLSKIPSHHFAFKVKSDDKWRSSLSLSCFLL